MGNGTILKIDTITKQGSAVGGQFTDTISATFSSPGFANFKGGKKPEGTFVLENLEGTRTIRVAGKSLILRPFNSGEMNKLMFNGNKFVTLWAKWRNPRTSELSDYNMIINSSSSDKPPKAKTRITPATSTGSTPIPEPGLLGLLTLGVTGLVLGRRRSKMKAIDAIA